MSRIQKIKVQAKTLDKALIEAAKQLSCEVAQLKHEVISQTDGGFFGFLGSRRVEIEAWSEARPSRRPDARNSRPRDRQREQAARQHQPAQEERPLAPDLNPEETKNLVEELREFCAGICKAMTGDVCHVSSDLKGDRLILNIEDEYMAQQIGRNAKVAESLEHLLRKKPRHLKRELPFRIFIDVNGMRMDRESELIDMAKDLSAKVFENQKPIVLNYKSSYDRKIIHMALDQDDRVYTKSIGTGTNRKLMILPSKDAEVALHS